jgi:hypothetical protein
VGVPRVRAQVRQPQQAPHVVHEFRLTSPAEVDQEFVAWLTKAYRVGAQEHLRA